MRTLVLITCLAAVACNRPGASAVLDHAEIERDMETRIEAAIEGPAVSRGFDVALEAIVAAPAVTAAAGPMFARISADPEIAATAGQLFETLGSTPEMQALLAELMRLHPDAPPERLGELVELHVQKAFDSPAFDRGWSTEFDKILTRFRSHPDALALLRKAKDAVDLSRLDVDVERRWGTRIVALAGERRPSRARGTELWREHFWKEQRVDQVLVEALAAPAFRASTAQALGALLAHESLSKELHRGLGTVLADPVARGAMEDVMRACLQSPHDEAGLIAGIGKLFAAPSAIKALESALHVVATDPAIATIGRAWIDALRREPTMQALYDRFWFAW